MSLVLITGARGFIGQHLTRALATAGHRVCGLGHGAWPDADAQRAGLSRWINGDIVPANLRLLQQACGTPSHVIHLAGGSSVGAALANPREDFFRTVATTTELLEWVRAEAPSCSLLAVSSAAVYGAGHDGRIDEAAALNPFSPYGHHKRMMEELCQSYAASFGIRASIVRLFSVYGPGLTKQLLWDACSRLAQDADTLTLGGTGNEMRDWTDVRDAARALVLLLGHVGPDVPVFNGGTGIGTSVADVAAALTRAWRVNTGKEARIEFNGRSRPGDPFRLIASPGRLQALGFEWETSLDRGVNDYVSWFLRRQRGAIE
jgi:UDP-glucose 4-epimerase